MRFSLTRLIVAVAVFAPALAWTRGLRLTGILVAMVIATPAAVIVLVGKRSDMRRIFRCLVYSAIGLVAGFFCGPDMSISPTRADHIRLMICMMAGVFFGGLVAGFIETNKRTGWAVFDDVVGFVLSTVIGAFAGAAFIPNVAPPYKPDDEYLYPIAGAFIGGMFAILFTRWKRIPPRSEPPQPL